MNEALNAYLKNQLNRILFPEEHQYTRSISRPKNMSLQKYNSTPDEWFNVAANRRITEYPAPFDKPENFKIFTDCPYCPQFDSYGNKLELPTFVKLKSARTHVQRKHPNLIKRSVLKSKYEPYNQSRLNR